MSETESMQPGRGEPIDALGELVRAAGRRAAPPEAAYRAVREAARDTWRAKVRQRRRRRRLALAASVAAAAGLVTAGIGLYDTEPAPVATLVRAEGALSVYSRAAADWRPLMETGATLHPGDRLRTGPAGGAALELADGGSVRIASGSDIGLEAPRSLELVFGMLYVDSEGHGRAEAIEIATALGRVRDVGTQFEVRGGETLRVRVRSGRVELVDTGLEGRIDASAGQELELDVSGELERRAIAPDAASWSWAAALAVPPDDGDTVLEYLEWIARETGKPLRFESPGTELRAELVRWRGDVQGLTPLEILEAVVATSDFTYEIMPDGGILLGER